MIHEVLIFVQQGCQACHELQQIVDRISVHYSACIRSRVVDVNQESILADTMQIRETPTVVGSRDFSPVIRMVGAENAEQRLLSLYGELLQGGTCQVATWRGDV